MTETSVGAQNDLQARAPKKKSKRIENNFRSRLSWFLFISPVVIGILVFSLYPMIMSLWYSLFQGYDGVKLLPEFYTVHPFKGTQYAFGFKNYQDMFKALFDVDGTVWHSLKITFSYAIISIPLNLVLSFLVALLLNSKVQGIGIYRVIYYLPVIIPTTVFGALFGDFFGGQGLAYGIFDALNISAFEGGFFSDIESATALPTFIAMNLWTLGASMILWLSSLKNVSPSLLEAAEIDGANRFVRLIKIIVPMCTPILFYNMVTGIIGVLQTLGPVVAITGGTAPDSLRFFAYEIYSYAFGSQNMGYASALAWLLFLIIALMTGLMFLISKKWVYYGDGGEK